MNAVTVGCFDLLHRGHLNLLCELRRRGRVVVLVHDDTSIEANKGRPPAQPLEERVAALRATGNVDEVIRVDRPDPSFWLTWLFNESPRRNEPWVYVRGDDWPQFPGRDAVEQADVPIVLVPYTPGVSTTLLRAM